VYHSSTLSLSTILSPATLLESAYDFHKATSTHFSFTLDRQLENGVKESGRKVEDITPFVRLIVEIAAISTISSRVT